MILKDNFIKGMAEHIKAKLNSAVYIQNNIEYQATNFITEIEGSLVKVRIYLDESVKGTITGVRVKADGQTWIEQIETFEKPSDRGFYKLISINIREVVQNA